MIYDALKRLIDIFLATILIIGFSPIFLFVPILIKLDSAGPVFAEIPKRVGKNRKPFRMYKFRSMIANAHQLLQASPGFRRLYEQYKKNSYKLKDDPRITRVGRFLRRFSLDELPQVFNVLRGEMSIVGPRAYYPEELEEQQKNYPQTRKHVKELLKAKPGITGYWQVTGRSEINFDKRVKMDVDYVRKRSILEDLVIIAKTPWVMVSGKGAL
ncbi:MAG TPA: sugar transferase [Candidatus Bathyarchaeia archaeon]|nr:sugar transferase [Candidatus Bathyarchaeia archaeon]